MPTSSSVLRTALALALLVPGAAGVGLAGAAPAFAAPSGPVVVDLHTSVHPPEVYSMTSSSSGTLYYSDRKGASRLYLRAALFSAGNVDVELGEGHFVTDMSVVADKVALPMTGADGEQVVRVDWCTVGSCTLPLSSMALAPSEVYLANTGTGIMVYDHTSGMRQLRIKPFGGRCTANWRIRPEELMFLFRRLRSDARGISCGCILRRC